MGDRMKIAGIEIPDAFAGALRECKRHFVAAAFFSLLINLLYLSPTIYMLQVYDRIVPTGGELTLLFVTMALVLALGALSMLDMLRNRLLLRASQKLDALLAPEILRQTMGADSVAAGQAMRDFDTIRGAVGTPVIAAMFDAPWSPVFLLAAFLLHFWIGLLSVVAAMLLVGLAWLNQRSTQSRMEIASTWMAAAHNAQQAAAVHGSTLKALGMVEAVVLRQLDHRRNALLNTLHAQFAGSRLTATSRFFRLFVQSAALGLGALLAIAGDISAGAIIASSVLLSRALQPIESIIGAWSSLASSRAAMHRLGRVLDSMPERRVYTALPPPSGLLEVEDVGFRGRDGRPILLGVSFRAEPGKILGIVGPSGSGKTTLGKVAAGALQPTIGSVRIDGARLGDWEQDSLGRHIGYIPQEPSLFEGTIKQNISRFARPSGADEAAEVDEAVIRAAKQAGIHELVLQLPQAYDTALGLMGAGLSAGQSQRVALARALYRDPALLILDEPNAFLDQEGEAALVTALVTARARRAAIVVIAHRRGLLDIADRLLVLEGGRSKMIGAAADIVARLSGPKTSEDAA